MELEGLDYNTGREKMRLKAYGRDIQQMVDACIALPTKEERQRCANQIVETMKRVVSSQLSYKERTPILWYHLALLSDFKLDIDYPVAIEHEDELARTPDRIPYTNKQRMPVRHYGRMLFAIFDKLKGMPEGAERDELALLTANQMYRSLLAWGMSTTDKEKVVSDLARFTDGVIQLDVHDISIGESGMTAGDGTGKKKKKRKK